MSADGFPLLSVVIFLPAAGIVPLLFLREEHAAVIRWITLSAMGAGFLASLPLYFGFAEGTADLQFAEHVEWIPQLGITYHIGIDGISLLLVMLSTFLGPIVVLSTWTAVTRRIRGFMIALLSLQTGMLGVFCAMDLFLFYVFWEAMLVPMYFIIGIWGGPRRIYAAVKFFIFTMLGSVLMLVGILGLYFEQAAITGTYSFDLSAILRTVTLSPSSEIWYFLAFALAFAIKVPLFPFHTWLPDAHVEAPTAGSVVLAAVLLKMGTYGLVRFCLPLFPAAAEIMVPWIGTLAVIGIIYGALVSMVQPDLKKLVAYSSVSHLGFVVLGIFVLNPIGITGGLIQMINHGLSTGALFLLVGMIYERRHTRLIADFGGLARPLPVFSTCLLIAVLASVGLPGLNGFVGEFLILVGAFQRHWAWAAFAATGVILAAVYLLWMYQRVIFGRVTHAENAGLSDLSGREVGLLVPILAACLWIGVYPSPLLRKMDASVHRLLQVVELRSQHRAEVLPWPYLAPPPAALVSTVSNPEVRLR